MIETDRDYCQALNRIEYLLNGPHDHTRVLKKLVEEIEIYEAKIAREDKILAKTKNYYHYTEKHKSSSVEEMEENVVCWAEDRDLYMQSTPDTRFKKILEEVEELQEAYQHLGVEDIRLEAGDVIVTLINFLHPMGLDLRVCLQAAYDKIKNRDGQMVDGTFVKAADLQKEGRTHQKKNKGEEYGNRRIEEKADNLGAGYFL